MALPAVGDGYQVGDGNTGEDLLVGRTGQPVQFGGSAAAELGFFGATPAAQPAATNQAAIASTAAVSVSATQWGFYLNAGHGGYHAAYRSAGGTGDLGIDQGQQLMGGGASAPLSERNSYG